MSIRILFLCHGNICRSPMAQMVMQALAQRSGAPISCDSAAVSREELGNPIHPGARRKLQREGVALLPHRARQMTREDYDRFDWIVAMDRSNLRAISRITGSDPAGKVRLLLSFTGQEDEVADPWYTGDFDAAYRDILRGCTALLDFLQKNPH